MSGDDLIARAARIATRAHEGQRRRWLDEPYIRHPERVAARVARLPGATPEMVAAAWLHDVVEDTDVALDELRRELGDVVAALVDELTDAFTPETTPHENRAARKRREQDRIAATSAAARAVKLADLEDNLVGTDAATGFARLFADESERLIAAIARDDIDADLRAEVARALDGLRARITAARRGP